MRYRADNIAKKIKALRTAAGLTQVELAEKLYVSPQSISKWELGVTLPEPNTLCAAAEFFGCDMNEFFIEDGGEPMYVGVDGGGTKTEFVLSDKNGHIRRRVVLGTGNPTIVGIEKTCALVIDGIQKLLDGQTGLAAVCCGIAGCSDRARSDAIRSEIKKRYPSAAVEIGSDIMNVFHCLPDPERSVAAICGTGVAVFAFADGSLHRFGGWGQLFDECGSGYDIGREAIRTALAELDGFGKASVITDRVKQRLGDDVFGAIIQPENRRRDVIASFAPIVFDAYDTGDEEAARILDENFGRVAGLIDFAVQKFGCRGPVMLSGGLTERWTTVRRFLAERSRSGAAFEVLKTPQVCGACFAALRASDTGADTQTLRTLADTYRETRGGFPDKE